MHKESPLLPMNGLVVQVISSGTGDRPPTFQELGARQQPKETPKCLDSPGLSEVAVGERWPS